MDTTGIQGLRLMGNFPLLRNLLAGVNLILDSGVSENGIERFRLYPKVLDDGVVSVELRSTRSSTVLLTFFLHFASSTHAEEFSRLANKRKGKKSVYRFCSDDNCSIVAVPSQSYRDTFEVYENTLPISEHKFSAALELRKFSTGLDVILSIVSELIGLKNDKGVAIYHGVAALDKTSRNLTINIKDSKSTVLVVTFSRQIKSFDPETYNIAILLNFAFSFMAPVMLTGEADHILEIVIGTPPDAQNREFMEKLMDQLNQVNQTPSMNTPVDHSA